MKSLEVLEMVESAGLVGNGLEMQRLVEELGGWDVVLNAWKATGGRAEAFANVWTMVVHLSKGRVEFAQRMQVDPEVVNGFVESLQAMVVTKRAGEVEAALHQLCDALAAGYEDLASQSSSNSAPTAESASSTHPEELGAWWRARCNEFALGILGAA